MRVIFLVFLFLLLCIVVLARRFLVVVFGVRVALKCQLGCCFGEVHVDITIGGTVGFIVGFQ